MKRRVVSIVALLLAWGSFGLIFNTLMDREDFHCQRFKDLAAECLAPFATVMVVAAILFVLSTSVLVILALRPHSPSDRN